MRKITYKILREVSGKDLGFYCKHCGDSFEDLAEAVKEFTLFEKSLLLMLR